MPPHIISVSFSALILLAAGFIRGYSGFGSGMVAVLGLTLVFPPAKMVPVILLLEVIASSSLLPGVWELVDWSSLGWLSLGALFGTPAGAYILASITGRNQKREQAGELTLHSGNTDTLAFQAAVVGLVYVLTYLLVKYLGMALPHEAGKMLWGFFFFFGLGLALCVQWLMKKMRLEYLVDPGIQKRITGWSVDFLIVATVAAIQVMVVWQYIVPFLTVSLTCGVLTTVLVLFLGKGLPSYNLERTVAIYGTVTGTVSCGLLLLRIADPDFQTPVAVEIALMNVFAVPIVGGCTVLVNGPLWWHWITAFTVLVFVSIMAASLAAIKILGLWKRAKT